MAKPSSDSLAVAAAAVVVGALALVFFPAIYGGDPIVRVTNWERLQLAYQLPMIQVVVHLAMRVCPEPWFLKVVMIAIAALAACGMATAANVAFGSPHGMYAGLLFATNHFMIYLGNSLYQEILELGFVLWGISLIFAERAGGRMRILGYVLVAAGCLTRYEAWSVAAGGALTQIVQQRPALLPAAATLLRWGAGPLAWLIWNAGFSPAGSSLFDPAFRLARLWRIPYVAGATLNHATSAVTLLALLGVWLWYKAPERRRQPLILAMVLAGVLFLLALPSTSMGVQPDLDRYVTNREAHFLLPLIFLMASAGLVWIHARFTKQAAVAALLVIFAYEGYAAARTLRQSVNEGNLALDVRIAGRLSESLTGNAQAIIFARPHPPGGIENFFDMIRRRRGEAGVEVARRNMAAMNTWPLDFARIWVHAPKIRSALMLAQSTPASDAAPAMAVVFDDYSPSGAAETALLERIRASAQRTEVLVASAPGRPGATLYSLSPPAPGSD